MGVSSSTSERSNLRGRKLISSLCAPTRAERERERERERDAPPLDLALEPLCKLRKPSAVPHAHERERPLEPILARGRRRRPALAFSPQVRLERAQLRRCRWLGAGVELVEHDERVLVDEGEGERVDSGSGRGCGVGRRRRRRGEELVEWKDAELDVGRLGSVALAVSAARTAEQLSRRRVRTHFATARSIPIASTSSPVLRRPAVSATWTGKP